MLRLLTFPPKAHAAALEPYTPEDRRWQAVLERCKRVRVQNPRLGAVLIDVLERVVSNCE